MVWATADDGYGGVRMEWTDRDFPIKAADLVLGSAPTLPERGDVIRETQGTKTFIYEVMAPGKEPPWRWSDTYRKLLRIHTKQVGTEATERSLHRREERTGLLAGTPGRVPAVHQGVTLTYRVWR
jgi:hypothetical protein